MLIRPLIIAARILDEDYPKDPNPENWRTISGAKVHLNEKGQIDGGAGSKFNKKKFGSNFSAQEGFSGEYAAPKTTYKEKVILNPFLDKVLKENDQLSEESLLHAGKKLMSASPNEISDIGSEEELDEALDILEDALNIDWKSEAKVKKLKETLMQKAAAVFTEASVQSYQGGKYPFRKSNYTKAHLDNAVWCESMEESKKKFDTQALDVWANANQEEREAIREYTSSYSKFNEPLRGIEYGTGKYKGVGSIDFENISSNGYGNLKPGEARDLITNMTNYIDRSAFDEDVWLQRGCNYKGMDKFLNLSKPLKDYSLDELKAEILGTKVTEHGFMSCGAAKGTGFDDKPVMFNIYAPAGTKMAYAPNFSAFKKENEMILQRGTQFRVAKIEENPHGGFFIDLEVVGSNMQKV